MHILPSLFALPVGEAILPGPVVATEKWRMIHFKYRKKRSMMHVMDGYDVSQPTTRQHQVLHTHMYTYCTYVGHSGQWTLVGNKIINKQLNNYWKWRFSDKFNENY